MAKVIKRKVSGGSVKKLPKNLSKLRPKRNVQYSRAARTKKLEGRIKMVDERDKTVGGKPMSGKVETDPRKNDKQLEQEREREENRKEAQARKTPGTKEWKEAEEEMIPHPFITERPSPFSQYIVVPDEKSLVEPTITVEEQSAQGIPTDNKAAKDTPRNNRIFRESVFSDIPEAAGYPEPNRVGNELTRMENAVVADFGAVIALQNFIMTDEVQEKLDDEQKKKLQSLLVSY